jgi:subtilase family serine protease
VTVPDSVPGGTYYLAMVVDTTTAVAESNELNNLQSDPDPVVVPALPAPDLGPDHFFASHGGFSEAYSIDASVRNFGTAPARDYTVGFYLSGDTVITTADAFIAHQSFSGLAAGAAQDVGGSLWIPGEIPAGTYYLGMVVDTGNAVGESNEANNAAHAPDPVTILDLPDLAEWEFAPPHGAVDRTFSIYNSVWNCGRATAGPFTAGFYLSTDTTITAADTLIGTRSFGGATPGYKWAKEYTSVTVPDTVPAGSYYVGMIIDPAGAVAESMETNNVVVDEIGVTIPSPPAPDLEADSFFVTDGWVTGDYSLLARVRNNGTAPAGAFTVQFYLSDDTAITTADTLLATGEIAGLAAGYTDEVIRYVSVPASVPAGTYYVGSIVDSGNTVAESDEANNAVRAPNRVTVSDLPDLAAESVTPPTGAVARTFVINSTIKNYGRTQAGPFSVGFYLSTDMTFTTADALIGTLSLGGLAALTASTAGNTTVTVPASVPAGTYYVGAIVDVSNAVDEAKETNNITYSKFWAVTVPAPSVLAVPPSASLPTDTNGDRLYDDVNGNGRKDFADIVLYFNQMSWIAANEPMPAFDCNGNGRIDFADVVWLFNHL